MKILFEGLRVLGLTQEEKRIRKREWNRIWNMDNPDKVKAMKRKHLEKHRDQIYKYLVKWRKDN